MSASLRIAWLAPYPVELLVPALKLARLKTSHPSSWIVQLAKALGARPDIELHVVTESQLVPRSQVVVAGKITFHVVRFGVPFTYRGYPPWFPLELLLGFRPNVRRLLKELQTIQPDLVHAHGTESVYGLAAVAAPYPHLISIQGIITEICKVWLQPGLRRIGLLEQQTIRRGCNFGCRTAFDTRFVRQINPQARVFNLPEAINPCFFQHAWRPPEFHNILFVGTLIPYKGLDVLLDALAIVRQTIPDAKALIIGENHGDTLAALRQRCAQLGLSAAVEFLGRRSPAEIVAYQQQSRVFVLPSRVENSPNSLAEAMAAGLPVVATAVGGVPSMIQDGETGLLVPPSDPPALAEKLVRVLSNPEPARQLGARARLTVQSRQHPEIVVTETLAAYHEILRRSGRGES